MIPRLTSSDLLDFKLPSGPFIVDPEGYRVVDGDTIKIVSGRRDIHGPDITAKSLRFRSIACEEVTRNGIMDRPLQAAGFDPNGMCLGNLATAQMRRFTKGRPIVIQHTGRHDKYHRLLCDIAVLPTRKSPLHEAISLERVMIARGHAEPFDKNEPLPALRPLMAMMDLDETPSLWG